MKLLKFHPILFQPEMVVANLEGRKTETRRLNGFEEINKHPNDWQFVGFDTNPTYIVGVDKYDSDIIKDFKGLYAEFERNSDYEQYENIKCPYGQPGDILWVREKFGIIEGIIPKTYKHFAGKENYAWGMYGPPKWKSCLHMPKEACRIFLLLKEVKVERLQDITEEEAIAEGVLLHENGRKWLNYFDRKHGNTQFIYNCYSAKESFKTLWTIIHGFRDEPYAWYQNPWVWVLKYEVLTTKGIDDLKDVLLKKFLYTHLVYESIENFLTPKVTMKRIAK